MSILEDKYCCEVQKFLIELLIANTEAFSLCHHHFKTEYFDGELQQSVNLINDYFDKTKQIPPLDYINAHLSKNSEIQNFQLPSPVPTEQIVEEFEELIRNKAHEQVVFEGVKLINEGKYAELHKRMTDAEQISIIQTNQFDDGNLVSFDDYQDELPDPWFIPGLIVQNSTAILWGPTNSDKTFVMLDMALRVACGMDWHGKAIARRAGGTVLYIAAEDAKGVKIRTRQWASHHGVKPDKFKIYDKPIDLIQPGLELSTHVQNLIAKFRNNPPEMICFDTMARCTLKQSDENASAEAKLVANALIAIQEALGCVVITTHHTGKDVSRGERGSQAYRDNLHCSIELVKSNEDKESGTADIELVVHKQKSQRKFNTKLVRKVVEIDGPNGYPEETVIIEQAMQLPGTRVPDDYDLVKIAEWIDAGNDESVSPSRALEVVLGKSRNAFNRKKLIDDYKNYPLVLNGKILKIITTEIRGKETQVFVLQVSN